MVRLKLMPEPVLQAADPAGEWVRWDDYAELQASADALVLALRFYADEDNQYPNNGPWGVYSEDFGTRASIALAQHGKVK